MPDQVEVDFVETLGNELRALREEFNSQRIEFNSQREELKAQHKEISSLKTELSTLKADNMDLQFQVQNLDQGLDDLEQHSRKNCLVMSGGAMPKEKPGETSVQTRAVASKVIKDKLGVNMRGDIVACHRLKNRERVLVRFSDLEDRNDVYQAKFEQREGTHVIIHESLTQRRGKMTSHLGALKNEGKVANYHTRNGVIMARNSPGKRYVPIQPWFNDRDITDAMNSAPALPHRNHNNGTNQQNTRMSTNTNSTPTTTTTTTSTTANSDRMLITQSLEHIPAGHVLDRAADLSDYVVNSSRQPAAPTRVTTRQAIARRMQENQESPSEPTTQS